MRSTALDKRTSSGVLNHRFAKVFFEQMNRAGNAESNMVRYIFDFKCSRRMCFNKSFHSCACERAPLQGDGFCRCTFYI